LEGFSELDLDGTELNIAETVPSTSKPDNTIQTQTFGDIF
jgi:hypothetical protein